MVRHAVLLLIGAAACSRQAPEPAAKTPADSTALSAAPAPASVMGTLVGVDVLWGDYHARGDAAGISTLYTEDAVLMTADGTDVVGRDAIRKYFERLFATRPDSVLATNARTEALDVAGDRAYEAGTVTFTLQAKRPGAGPRPRVVPYVTFWQKTPDGRWRIRRAFRPT